MRIFLMLAFFTVAVPDRRDPSPKEEARPPHEQILGDWAYVGNGPQPDPNAAAFGYVFRIMASETVWLVKGKPMPSNGFTAKVTFDWTKNPVAFDLTPHNGGSPILAITRLEGDRLTMAWSNSNTLRPTDFDNAGNKNNIHHFVRVRK